MKLSDDKKRIIAETVENLKHLDKESLLLVKSGAELLKARDALDRSVNLREISPRRSRKEMIADVCK